MPTDSAAFIAEERLTEISTFLSANHKDSNRFRTLVDDWFAHDQGGDLWLNPGSKKRIRTRWFNRRDNVIDFRKRRRNEWHVAKSLFAMHFQSAGFIALVSRKLSGEPFDRERDWVVKDHSVPLEVLRQYLREELSKQPERFAASSDELRRLLRLHYRIAAIAKTEDRLLEDRFRQTMPVGITWHDAPHDHYARYRDRIERAPESEMARVRAKLEERLRELVFQPKNRKASAVSV